MYFSLHKSMHVLLMACVHCLWPFLTQEVDACKVACEFSSLALLGGTLLQALVQAHAHA